MQPPSDFVRRLDKLTGGRLRIRWSHKESEWHLEEKVGRAALPPIRVDEGRDDLIRARDGYRLVMIIRPGDRMPCPRCGATLKVPVLRVGEVVCRDCSAKRNRQVAFVASYWPLDGESLFDHLRKIDPLTGGIERMMADIAANNARLKAAEERDLKNYGEAVLRDGFTQIAQIPSVGYTGKARY